MINHELDCGGVLSICSKCKICEKQYAGEITDAFQLRWSNYKANESWKKNENCTQ